MDVNAAVTFYLKLGLKLIVDSRPRYVRFESFNTDGKSHSRGDSTFSVSHAKTVSDISTTLYFEVDDLDKTYSTIKSQGLDFVSKPEDKRWLWREASLKDPDGRPLILYSAGINRKNPPWRVKKKRWFEYFSECPVNLMK